jgi:hypothetical protein
VRATGEQHLAQDGGEIWILREDCDHLVMAHARVHVQKLVRLRERALLLRGGRGIGRRCCIAGRRG